MLPGFVAVSTLLMTVINGALAQGLLIRFGRNFRPTPDITTMQLPKALSAVTAAAALGGIVLPGWPGYYGINLAVILVLPFFFLGLAVVHALCRKQMAGAFLLVGFYGLLIIFSWPVSIFVAVLGVIEQWAEFRRRFD